MNLGAFVGNYKLLSQEHSNELLEALGRSIFPGMVAFFFFPWTYSPTGVGIALRALAKTAAIRLHISQDEEGEWIIAITGLKNTKLNFKMGTEFHHETPDGRNVKVERFFFTSKFDHWLSKSLQSTFLADGPKRVIEKEEWDDKVATNIYEINGDILSMVRSSCISSLKF